MAASTKQLSTARWFLAKRRAEALSGLTPAMIGSSIGAPGSPFGVAMRSLIAHLGIEQAARDIGHQIGEDHDRAIEQGHAHDQRIITSRAALHEIAADAGNA